MKTYLLTSLVTFFTLNFARAEVNLATTTVPFDLNRYMGTWYEVARLDNFFEKGMYNVTAQYSLQPNGTVKVVNSGMKKGKRKEAVGKARLADPPQNGSLEVAFFLNFYSPYRVLMLAEDYSYALVGSGSRYLWILSRTPVLPADVLDKIVAEASRRGFPTDKLLYTVK